ncbi:conserved hypothetical protein [Culex quinquefasciatus]|uniref:Uncharacterized protein n=1 Tax=Culex quinquefasciatus TaxID=7176 RepID=B0XDZ1_CULQU|nr:conserved hypothetical protein [Culex quinquefasciatus]|eukprot:XP_001867863.1 conserved hypothetical protein [Culex quinquefasciatus]
MRENFFLLVGTACVLVGLQVARSELSADEVEYDEEGFWIGHGLGSRKEGVTVIIKAVPPGRGLAIAHSGRVDPCEYPSCGYLVCVIFGSRDVLTYFREVVLDFNPKNFYIKLNLYNITNLRLQRTVYGHRSPNALKRRSNLV